RGLHRRVQRVVAFQLQGLAELPDPRHPVRGDRSNGRMNGAPRSRPRYFPDLASFVRHLESGRELVRVSVEVDPRLEVSEITQRVLRRGGPALLFERVRGADFPLVTNLFGSMRRIEVALGRHPREIGSDLLSLAERLNPPSWKALWSARGS